MIDMENWGLTPQLVAEAEAAGAYLGRVVSQYRDCCRVVTTKGMMNADVSGKFRFAVKRLSEYPAVGDFVLLDRSDDQSGNGVIQQVLPRRSAVIRKAAGTGQAEQVVAANLDLVFICMSLNDDFNLRRLERYLGMVWDSGATPVVVLTKADLCVDLAERMAQLETVAFGVDVVVTSSFAEDGYQAVRRYLGRGRSIALIGSSGVGKSTLLNRLLGREFMATQEIRQDDKGRHTTTNRQMLSLPDGGVIIDTPGMRELGLEGADLAKTFSDIDALAKACRFSDCGHGREPGCAVRRAIEQGRLPEERLLSYQKLQKEAKYQGLNAKQIEAEKLAVMFADVGGMKNARRLIQEQAKNRRRH